MSGIMLFNMIYNIFLLYDELLYMQLYVIFKSVILYD